MYDIAVFGVLLSVVVGGTAAAWLLARHDARSSAFLLGVFLLDVTFWAATHLGTLFTGTLQWHLLFTQLSYVSVVSVPVVWLAFALRYTDRGEFLSARRVALLSVVPLVNLALVFTAQHHTLFYASMEMGRVAGHPILTVTSGPFHAVNIVYSYILLMSGTGLLLSEALSNNRLYRRQSAVLVACITVPWIVNMSYHVGIRPVPWVDPTPVAFILSGVPLGILVVRTDLASFLPVAHRRVFRTLDDPILVVTPTGQVIDANDAAQSVLGGDGDGPVVGNHVSDVVPDTLLDGDALRGDLDGTVECTVEHEGTRREYIARRREVNPDREGGSRGQFLALTDITVQKNQQREIAAQRDELEAQAARLERKNEQLERLANVVSHDMQAPLSTADKLLSLLRMDLDDPDDSVDRSLSDLGGVIDRLRAFADHIPRLAREGTDVEVTEECDLEAVATESWEMVETGDVELRVEGTRRLQADRRRLQQVFENLFRNAVEHGLPKSGPSTSSVSTDRDGQERLTDGGIDRGSDVSDRTESGGENVERWTPDPKVTAVRVGTLDRGFFVADDGPGIDPDRRDDVFEYGVSTGEGSGFGLAIVRTIVEAHGWEISVGESDVGGARFEVQTGD